MVIQQGKLAEQKANLNKVKYKDKFIKILTWQNIGYVEISTLR